MRFLLLTGTALAALAGAPAYAQDPAPTATGDPIVDRLNALEARVKQLEARNAELEQQAAATATRVEAAEKREAKQVQFDFAPSLSDEKGDFTFKPRGVIEADYGVFNERAGGYDYNDGTAFRRARIGLEGTAMKVFNYRIEVDFAGNQVGITDAYLQYAGIKDLLITAGQHKAPYGLESNNSDNYNVFIERGMFTNAFGNAGAERRIGASVSYQSETLNAAVGVFGDSEAVSRSNVTPTPDESWGVNGRVAWEPIFDTGKILHLGVSGYYRTSLKSGDVQDALRLTERPNIRVDGGNIIDSGVITGVESLTYLGGEAAAVFGPVTLAGEYGRLWTDR